MALHWQSGASEVALVHREAPLNRHGTDVLRAAKRVAIFDFMQFTPPVGLELKIRGTWLGASVSHVHCAT
jgi:hypothetical protein